MGFFARNLEAPAERSRSGIEWEETGCLLCGGIRWSPLVEAPDRAPGSAGLWFVARIAAYALPIRDPAPIRSARFTRTATARTNYPQAAKHAAGGLAGSGRTVSARS